VAVGPVGYNGVVSDVAGDEHSPLAPFVRGLPKAEVHLHLEGCVPPELAASVARAEGGDPARFPTLPVRDLAGLLSFLDWSCAHITDPAQLEAIAYGLMQRAGAGGVQHVDVIANPTHWPAFAGRLGAFVGALDAGFTAAEHDGLGTATLCLSLKRTQGALEADELVAWILTSGQTRVAALSIDGNEQDGRESHTERFRDAFRRAAAAGLHRCVHAGESSGPQGVRDALDALLAERIDHGIRCIEDPTLPGELAARQVPLDVCPTSNVLLGVVAELADHPIAELRRAGVRISINTDDPLLYGIDLLGEYLRVAAAFSWGADELRALARTSIESCFATPERRRELLAAHDRYD
jgi:adenosine deaminase